MVYPRSYSQSATGHRRNAVRLSALLLALALVAPPTQTQAQDQTQAQTQVMEKPGRGKLAVTGKGWSGGVRSGTLLGQVEQKSDIGPQGGLFLRHSIYPQLTAEVAGGYGRISGDLYSTDMTIGEMKLLYMPTEERYVPRTKQQMKPYIYAGLGGMRFNLDKIPVNRSPGTPSIGWAALVPAGVGLELPVLPNVALDLNAGYTYTFDDDLDAIRRGSKKDAYWHMSVGVVFRRVRGARMPLDTRPSMAVTEAENAEQVRQRIVIQTRYDDLRDSLAAALPASSAEALRTMSEKVHFGNNGAELSAEAKTLLRDKVVIFEANPKMRIVITGYSSKTGAPGYNMALGLRRAEAAKAYLVSQGVDPARVEISTLGEGELVVDGTGTQAHAANRRVQFRLQVADPFLVAPKN